MPYFSTIIPVHNRKGLVDRTIESVLNQDHPAGDNQIIVVDDGSTDGTADAIAARFGDAVRVIQRPNGGPAAARNTGIQLAQGRYVCFLDSDDLWFPWTLRTYAATIARYNEPAFLMTVPFEFSDETQLPRAPASLAVRAYPDKLAAHRLELFTGTSAFLIRRDALHAAAGFAEPATDRWILCEDIDLTLRLGTAAGFILIDSPPTFGYRRHPGSSWAQMDRTFPGARFLIAQERAGNYPGGPARRAQRLELLASSIRPIALRCLELNRRRDAWELYFATFNWQLRQRRWKFLAGFPLLALKARLYPAPTQVETGTTD